MKSRTFSPLPARGCGPGLGWAVLDHVGLRWAMLGCAAAGLVLNGIFVLARPLSAYPLPLLCYRPYRMLIATVLPTTLVYTHLLPVLPMLPMLTMYLRRNNGPDPESTVLHHTAPAAVVHLLLYDMVSTINSSIW